MKHLIIFITAALISLSALSQETNEQALSAEAKAELQEDLLQLQAELQEELQRIQQQLQKELQQEQKEQLQLIVEQAKEAAEERKRKAKELAVEIKVEAKEIAEEIKRERRKAAEEGKVFSGRMYEVYDIKTYNFSLGKNPGLDIKNKFGNIIVLEWDKPELQMVVERKVTSRESQEYAKKRLSCIKIEVKEEGSTVKAETKMDCEGSSRNSSLDIIYTVYTPKGTAYELEQMFGNIILKNSISGNVKAKVKHGNFTAEVLEKPANVEAQFGNANITKVPSLNLTSNHGNVRVSSAEQLSIHTTFSNANIGSVSTLTGKVKHGNYKLDRVTDMSMEFEFTNVNINNLERALNLTAKHGKLNVENVNANFSNIKVNGEFGNVQLGMSAAPNVAFDIQATFGGIDIPASWNEKVSKQIKDNNKRQVQGAVGSGASKLEVHAKHGSVKVK